MSNRWEMGMGLRIISKILLLGSASSLFAQTSGDSELNLWQMTYTAPTRFADGYTVKGKARKFQGSFRFAAGKLESLQGTVAVSSLSSGLDSRDESIRELVFKTADGRLPDLAFQAEPTDCKAQGTDWTCEVKGQFRIRDEWKPVTSLVYISQYQGRLWLHADGTIKLSDYSFYAPGPEALKVADRVDVVIDLLGPQPVPAL
jgi:polyisoprenoid-binding protein YceI